MYSAYAPPVCGNETAVTAAASLAHSTSNSTLTSSTWSSNSAPAHSHGGSHLGLPYSSFDPGPSTSGMYGSQGGVFPFPAYPSMHMPFEYQQIFMHKSAMQMHARDLGGRSEVKPHQCQQCLKSFSSNHQLVQHIRVHTGEKPYKCSYCDRRFKQLSHVQQHTRLHTGEC
ncbi:hypothetical protein HUJ04_000613 [Dendroctonus ponderosae]|nr:hypothetical protein HUJ04_000613 [Dendroctonus ponderosae]